VPEQMLLLLRGQRRQQVLALLRLEPRPGPLDPFGSTYGVPFVAVGSEQDRVLARGPLAPKC
jgi:hypothetical protein